MANMPSDALSNRVSGVIRSLRMKRLWERNKLITRLRPIRWTTTVMTTMTLASTNWFSIAAPPAATVHFEDANYHSRKEWTTYVRLPPKADVGVYTLAARPCYASRLAR